MRADDRADLAAPTDEYPTPIPNFRYNEMTQIRFNRVYIVDAIYSSILVW